MKTNKGAKNMKTRNKMSIIAIIAIITLAMVILPLAGCGGDDTAPETFTVTFNANGGDPTPAPQTVEKGKTVQEPTGVTKANNTLDGWYKESELTTKWNFADSNGVAADTVTASITLFAKWIEQPVQREFTDLTFLGKSIKLIDETGNAQDLKARGIWQKIQDGLSASTLNITDGTGLKFTQIYNTGSFAIVIESNKTYTNGYYGVDGYKVLFCDTQLLSLSTVEINECIEGAIEGDMELTKRTLSFGTPACQVTIKSDDTFTAAEWSTLCDKTAAAIDRGYNTGTIPAKPIIETYFKDNAVTVVLLKSATLDCEVKSDVPNTMYLKADGSVIDGISDANIRSAITAMRQSTSYHYPE